MRFDAFTRGRYATDASIYQIMPGGRGLPEERDDIAAALAIAREAGVPVIARGGGTSQNGQPIGAGLVVDCSRHLNAVGRVRRRGRHGDGSARDSCSEHLNARLKGDGLFFPVEPSTASRCTIGGMAGNNSCGARSIRYGKMVDNVLAIERSCRTERRSSPGCAAATMPGSQDADRTATTSPSGMVALADRERDEIEARVPEGAAAGRRLQPRRAA